MNSNLSNEEKKKIAYLKQNVVRNAWKEEKGRVLEGVGTRKWSEEEQKELLERGKVKGYEGHHMKCVSLYPEYAGDVRNIQFLSESEHLRGAHNGYYRNPTNGYYDPETGIMHDFGDELKEIPLYDLKANELVFSEEEKLKAYYVEEQSKTSVDLDSFVKLKEEYENGFNQNMENVHNESKSESYGMDR